MQDKRSTNVAPGEINERNVEDDQEQRNVMTTIEPTQNHGDPEHPSINEVVGNEKNADGKRSTESAAGHAEIADKIVI